MRVLVFLLLLVLVDTIRAAALAEVDAENGAEKRSTCTDNYPRCPLLVEYGECKTSPYWMLINCRLSCSQCDKTTTTTRIPTVRRTCNDIYAYCPRWAIYGSCENNWMLENCRLSCKKCSITPDGIVSNCRLNGKIFAEGETYEQGCVTYKCVPKGFMRSVIEIVDQLCRDYYGVCHSPGETFTYSPNGRILQNCQCTITGDSYKFIEYKCGGDINSPANRGSGCELYGNHLADDEIYELDCVTYKCIKNGSMRSYPDIVKITCMDYYGNCRSPGETFTYLLNGRLLQNCQCTYSATSAIDYKCGGDITSPVNSGSNANFSPVNRGSGCELYGNHLADDEIYELDCVTYKCIKNGSMRSYPDIINITCMDYYGNCRSPGETFTYLLNGRLLQNCQCTYSATSAIDYKCGVETTGSANRVKCRIYGKVYAEGEMYAKDCETYKCLNYGYGMGIIKIVERTCRDYYGICRSPGETSIYSLNDRLLQCQCTIKDNLYIGYKCECQVNGKVFADDETYEHDCVTYKCMPKGFMKSNPEIVRIKCKDYKYEVSGICRSQGETYTYGSVHGYIKCNCTISDDGTTGNTQCDYPDFKSENGRW